MDAKIEQLQELVTTQKPRRADAIVWLMGNEYDRGEKVLELYTQKYAPFIVVTGNNERIVGDDHTHLDDVVKWLQKHGIDVADIFIDDAAMNTHDQAIHVVKIAKERGWKNFLLVGSTHHQLRAFLTFLKQAEKQGWQGRIINQPAHIDWDAKPSGQRQTTREALRDELTKLAIYRDNVVTVEEGLEYLRV